MITLLKKFLFFIGAKKDVIIETKETGKIELFDALLNRFTIHRAGKKFLSAVVSKMKKGKDDGLTSRSIMYWLKESNRAEFEKIKKTTVEFYMNKVLDSPTESDIA